MARHKALPYLLLAPAVLFLMVFFLYPFVLVAMQAFSDDSGWTLAHFQTMVQHWKFKTAFSNTLLLALAVVPIQLALSLLMASLVTKMKKFRDLVLYVWTIPLGISDLAAGIIWLAIFEQFGFLNSLLSIFGVVDQPIIFLSYQNLGMIFVAVMLAEIWRATAIMMVILVSGMGLIPKEYYEAAQIFGAGPFKQFYKITLPLLKPSLQTALILRVILAFEVFAVIATLGGTNMPVLMGETFVWQYDLQDPNVAAAFAIVILGISIASTLFFLKILRVPKEIKP